MDNVKVAITGVGVVSPQINSLNDFEKVYDYSEAMMSLNHYEFSQQTGLKGIKYNLPASFYLLASTDRALIDRGYRNIDKYLLDKNGVVIGTNFANRVFLEEKYKLFAENGLSSLDSISAPNMAINIPASIVSIKHKFHAFNITLTNSIVAGIESVILGYQFIKNRKANLVISGATEGTPPKKIYSQYHTPLAEGGSCVLLLECLTDVHDPNLNIYAFVLGGVSKCFPINNVLNKLRTLIFSELESILRNFEGVFNIYLNYSLDSFTSKVNELIIEYFVTEKRTFYLPRCQGDEGQNLCISPLLQCLHSFTLQNAPNSLIVSTSPKGNISFLLLGNKS